MKILHTSDWHLGKILHKFDLMQDHTLFLSWLVKIIEEHEVEYLLISGDLFDQHNPSNEARRLFYDCLSTLVDLNVQVIVTSGNHDSPSLFESNFELLKRNNIHMVGNFDPQLDSHCLALKDKSGSVKAVCLTLPYIRDTELRAFISGESYENKIAAIKSAILDIYKASSDLAKEKYPDVPSIAMGHLFINGSIHAEGEREIQLGNAAGIEVEYLKNLFDYMALGHIHSFNDFGDNVIYCGSPIPLSFGETDDQKKVLLINIEKSILDVKYIDIPRFRPYYRFDAEWREICDRMDLITFTDELPPFIDLTIHAGFDKIDLIQTQLESFKKLGFCIVSVKFKTESNHKKYESFLGDVTNIGDLKVNDVFAKRLENEILSDEVKRNLTSVFQEIYQEVLIANQ